MATLPGNAKELLALTKDPQFLTLLQSKLLRKNRQRLHLFTRTTTQKYTAIACLDDYLSFNLKALSSWMDPNKSQKHIRSIVTRIATFYLSLATTEEVERFWRVNAHYQEHGDAGIDNDANASESWKFVSRIKSKTRRIFSRLLLYQKNSATASAHWTSGWGISSGNRWRHKCTMIRIHKNSEVFLRSDVN